ncbi:AAA family ATPase [Ferrimonas kyonanensis]|uniref:AAA family ATPase n=1 Tax=Ferrimonas kyonanensis TaxID=364763 RepID=UPI000484E2E8|nr:AAA family ATPase [Ferrimonas kyonanensis]
MEYLLSLGGASTGKTTVINSIISGLEYFSYHIYPMALAGRAAKRLREATGRGLSTIAAFLRSEPIMSEKTALVIDEAAMVDAKRLAHKMTIINNSTRLSCMILLLRNKYAWIH